MKRQKFNFRYLLRKYIWRLRPLLFLIGSIAFIIYGKKTVLNSDAFKIKELKYSGVVKYVNLEDLQNMVTADALKQNIFTFNTSKLEESITKNFLGAKRVEVSKKYFNTLEVKVQEREPMAIVLDKTQTQYLVDVDGYVLGLLDNSYGGLPLINYDETLNIGQFINKHVVATSASIINQSKAEQVSVTSVSFKPSYATFYANNNTVVYMPVQKPVEEVMRIISRLLAKAVLESSNITKIDLRYDKVIVSYQ